MPLSAEAEMIRGRQAETLLNDPLLVEALSIIETKFEEKWKRSDPLDTEVREEAFRLLKCLELFKSQLAHVLQTGKLAAKSESDQQELNEQQRVIEDWDGHSDTAPAGHSDQRTPS